jgi:hypothetical protein
MSDRLSVLSDECVEWKKSVKLYYDLHRSLRKLAKQSGYFIYLYFPNYALSSSDNTTWRKVGCYVELHLRQREF